MAKKPAKTTNSRLSNIINAVIGNIDLSGLNPKDTITPTAYGNSSIVSETVRREILTRNEIMVDNRSHRSVTPESIFRAASSSTLKANTISENKMILKLLPDVDKAAKLMVASTISPNDLSLQPVSVTVDTNLIDDSVRKTVSEFASDFFEEKLSLKNKLPEWIREFGYSVGSTIFAIIPMKSFNAMEEKDFSALESSSGKFADRLASESWFGFGDNSVGKAQALEDRNNLLEVACESIRTLVKTESPDSKKEVIKTDPLISKLVEQFIATEAISLTDNADVLNVDSVVKRKNTERTKNVLRKKFMRLEDQVIASIDPEGTYENSKIKENVVSDPILLKLPTESVTVIHTPGDPTDHQGYLVLLNRHGNPVSLDKELDNVNKSAINLNYEQRDIFHQAANAYGINTSAGRSNKIDYENMALIYNQVMESHIKKRLEKAGHDNVKIELSDSVYRCMFTRYLQNKHTRVLFLPKELVTYMTFEYDETGNGVSKLEGIKFYLGLKMAVQVSKVLAAIKAAADNRKIEIKFTENMLEAPESIISTVVREYVAKSVMSFSIDPNQIQSQIIDKSLTVKGVDIPGMETFDITNEPDSKSGTFDFDQELLSNIDKSILNGLGVPAAAMNSLNEDDYARSVTTTNLFFAMVVSIDQNIIVKSVSDLIRKYARYSESFIDGVKERLKAAPKTDTPHEKAADEIKIIDEIIDSLLISLPKPNVAPSKAQFEALESMVSAITSMINSTFPDELSGNDDELTPIIRMVRSKYISDNISNYLETSGISGVNVPSSEFASIMRTLSETFDGLKNLKAMVDDKSKLDSGATQPEKGY